MISYSIGIDPSLAETGFCVIDFKKKTCFSGTLETPPKKDKMPVSEISRMKNIVDKIEEITEGKKSFVLTIEGISLSSRNTNVLAQLCGLNYMIRDRFYDLFSEGRIYIVPPTTLKKFITGKGNSKKEMMLLETYKKYGVSFSNNNMADAFGLAKIGEALINEQIKLTKPQSEVIEMLKKQHEKNKKSGDKKNRQKGSKKSSS